MRQVAAIILQLQFVFEFPNALNFFTSFTELSNLFCPLLFHFLYEELSTKNFEISPLLFSFFFFLSLLESPSSGVGKSSFFGKRTTLTASSNTFASPT